MRHNFLRRILGGILTGCILVTATVHAGTTQKDIDKAKDQITDLKKQKEDAKTCGQPVQNRKKTTALKACKPADPEGKSEGDLSHLKAENIG